MIKKTVIALLVLTYSSLAFAQEVNVLVAASLCQETSFEESIGHSVRKGVSTHLLFDTITIGEGEQPQARDDKGNPIYKTIVRGAEGKGRVHVSITKLLDKNRVVVEARYHSVDSEHDYSYDEAAYKTATGSLSSEVGVVALSNVGGCSSPFDVGTVSLQLGLLE